MTVLKTDAKHKIDKSCRSKRRYNTRKEARDKASILTKRYGNPLEAYPCHVCGGYHLTTVCSRRQKGNPSIDKSKIIISREI